MARLDFSSRFRGLQGLKDTFGGMLTAVRNVFGKKKIEDIVLGIHKQRFEPKGRNRFAQFDPDKRPWVDITDYTYSRRRKNKIRTQALVDTGALRNAVQLTRDNLSNALTVGVGVARVGIPIGSPEYQKGLKMQNGYLKRIRGGEVLRIPPRPFIGVGKLETTAVGRFIDRVFAKVLR